MKWKSVLFLVVFLSSCSSPQEPQSITQHWTQHIPNSDVVIELVQVASSEGVFWIGTTEVTWDLYDKFLQIVNSHENMYAGVDAITGPTPAYASVDRGYGRTGYPAISMSAQAADAFCAWLSKTTGRTFTIPTLAQYESANVGNGTAWHQWNAEKTTHPVGTKTPNSLGIFDLRGNVGEWVTTIDGPKVIGGSFRTPAEELGTKTMLTPIPDWNTTDPQLPRSPWWLADADFVGFRVVMVNGAVDE